MKDTNISKKSFKTLKLVALTHVGLAVISNTVSAASIALYVDGSDTSDTSIPAASSHPNVTAGTIVNTVDSANTIRDNFGAVDFNGPAANTFWFAINGGQDGTSALGGVTPTTDYIGFTLTVDAGGVLSMTSLTFNWGYGSNQTSITSDAGYELYANIDGAGFSLIESDSIASATYNAGDFTLGTSANIDLTGLAATADGGNIEFRLHSYTSANNDSGVTAYEQFQFNGDVTSVPEPSSTALLGLGGLALILRRRRK